MYKLCFAQSSGLQFCKAGWWHVHEAATEISGRVLQPRPGIPHYHAAVPQGWRGGNQFSGCLPSVPDGPCKIHIFSFGHSFFYKNSVPEISQYSYTHFELK